MNETMSCSRSIANTVEICVKTGGYLVNFWGEGYSRSEIFTSTSKMLKAVREHLEPQATQDTE